MKITEVRIKLMDDPDDRLQAFCSITIDDAFVVRDLKIIDGTSGPFVAMPSRKLTAHCPQCGCKNHLRAAHCNHCGIRLKDDLPLKDPEGRAKLYADIAHPINSECREMIQRRVIETFQEELALAKQPGYQSKYDDYLDYDATAESVDPIPTAALQISPGRTDPKQADAKQIAPKQTDPKQTDPKQTDPKQTDEGTARIESRQDRPRGPHNRPSKSRPSTLPATENGEFGAGIF